MKKRLFAAAFGLILNSTVYAHHIWIEPRDGQMTLQFGEFADNLRETTPGLLDKFGKPEALLVSAKEERPLSLNKTPGGFVIAGRSAENESIVASDAGYPVFEINKNGATIRTVWTPAARFVGDFSERQPKLALDIVPAAKPGQFRVYYNKKPLAKAKVAAVVQSGWSKEAMSDESGMVSFDLPWRGRYVLEVHHLDKTAGSRNGEAYDIASFVTSLSFDKLDGIEALPPVPRQSE
jgi:hypothetical protein